MNGNFWTIFAVSAVFAAVTMWSTSGFPAVRSDGAFSPDAAPIGVLADLGASIGLTPRSE